MTPPAHQRWNQSWTVLLGPNLRGSWSHWQPVRIRKMIPLKAARQWAVRRPVGFLGQNSRRRGRIFSHKASGTSQMVPNGLGFGFRRGLRLVLVIPGPSFRSRSLRA
jgi:hypothetical protein